MSLEENKTIVRRFFEVAWNENKVSVLDEIYSVDNVHHFGNTPGPLGPSQLRTMIKMWRDAIPDYHAHIENMIAEEDLVVTLLRFTGTHTGTGIFQIASRTVVPKNKQFGEMEIVIVRVANGKIVESWATWDRLSFLEQLGVIANLA